jgi:hypothetical protein
MANDVRGSGMSWGGARGTAQQKGCWVSDLEAVGEILGGC